MISPARLAAYEALRSVHGKGVELPAAQARARARLTDPRDEALAFEIAAGTLRWMAQLDHLIEQFAERPLRRIDPGVLDILRLSLYQVLHLDRIPAAAAVDDAVQMARRIGRTHAAGFVNAVLRSVVRKRNQLPLPARPEHEPREARETEEAIEYLGVALSHPRWLAARWLERYGLAGAEAWARFNNAPAPLTLRANTLKINVAELAAELGRYDAATVPGRYAPNALLVTSGSPLRTPLAERGVFLVQDEASQLVAHLAAARPGERVLDACAAPGGKTTALAADMKDRGLLVATDLRERRLHLLTRAVRSSGATCVRIARADARSFLPFQSRFDCVLLDAPCSGLGTIRRDPEIRWRRVETDLAALADIERTMLARAAEAVRPGGRLVYATCSSEPEENDRVIDSFLRENRAFKPVDPREIADDLPVGLANVLDADGRLRTSPARHGLEAFFGAMIRRDA